MIEFMQEAIKLGNEARLEAPPNPWVGCVIVKNGKIIGKGKTQPPGKSHAEIMAINEASGKTEGSTVYVTLEPCCHYGRTPPCTKALIKAKVAKVVIALEDPDPNVKGKGIREIKENGIEVIVGVAEREAFTSLEPYLYHRKTGLPYCIGKAAVSIDGRIAASDGSSQWITSKEARENVHRLRAESQAILVGSGTVIKDNPSLNVRELQVPKQPLRVILDTQNRIPKQELSPTLIFSKENLQPLENGLLPLKEVLKELGKRGVIQLLVEGGSKVLTSFLEENYLQRLMIYTGPKILGKNGLPLFSLNVPTLENSPELRLIKSIQLGQTILTDWIVIHPHISQPL